MMKVRVDLITGFLGSGKTTFIKKYADYLMRQGFHVGIIENDFGAVIVEPSGIYDVDEFFDVLSEDPLYDWYEVGSVIAIVDGRPFSGLSEHARYILASEIAGAGAVVLSKTNESDDVSHERVISYVNEALSEVKCDRKLLNSDVMTKDWDLLRDEDFDMLSSVGRSHFSYEKKYDFDDGDFETLYFMNEGLSMEKLRRISAELFEKSSFGCVFRVKGFCCGDGQWYEINATAEGVSVSEVGTGQEVFIVIGERLDEAAIRDRLAVLHGATSKE